MIAIVPAAGKGTRMASVTGGKPKELLRLGSETVLGRVLEEAREAGCERAVVVNSPDKPEIDAFLAEQPDIAVAYQAEMKGLAHAIACAEAESDVLVLLGDVVYHGGSPAERMANLLYRGLDGCIAVEHVPEERVQHYGICDVDEGIGQIRKILEKPAPHQTESRWAVAGRYGLSHRAMQFLGDYVLAHDRADRAAEIDLTGAINAMIESGMDFRAVALQPDQERVDCGNPEEYAAARRLPWN
jgi:UTP-glucose-1-phosphate uridylyltransferase